MNLLDRIKALTPPQQVVDEPESDAKQLWMAGWETMRSAVLYLLSEAVKPRPTWTFTVPDSHKESVQSRVTNGADGSQLSNRQPMMVISHGSDDRDQFELAFG